MQVQAIPAQAEFRALLVGIDYRDRGHLDPVHPLCGTVNDVHDMPHVMTERLGVATDLRLRLQQGREYFKAIITARPLDPATLGLDGFRKHFNADSGRRLAQRVGEQVPQSGFRATTELTLNVR